MKKIFLTILVMAALPSFVFAQGEPEVKEIVVTARRPVPKDTIGMKLTTNYVVRNLNGDVVCRLKKGDAVGVVGIAPDNERVNIKVMSGPCTGVTNGFIYVNYLRPTETEGQKTIEQALVEIDGLSLRKGPNVQDGSFLCALSKNTKLKITDEVQRRTRWVEVEVTNPKKGCPNKGWVAADYLKPDLDLSTLRHLTNSEVTQASTPDGCTQCDEIAGGRRSPVKKIVASGQDILAAADQGQPQGAGKPGPFTEFAKELQRTKKCPPVRDSDYKCNRGLMQMPTDGGNAGFCGTHHYSPDRPPGVDTYTAPHAACSLVGLAQEWKKTACPNDNAGCRIAWGDISHATRPIFNHHKEHTNGECIDIRPFNKGAFRDAGRTTGSADYDRDKTIAFIKMAKKYGASVMYSDRKLNNRELGVEWGGSMHNNHLHVCFEARNSTVQKACSNLTVDPAVCSEVQ